MGRESVLIPVSGGETLVGELHRQSPAQGGVGVLIMHPYAYLGAPPVQPTHVFFNTILDATGSMRDPVITDLYTRLCQCSWVGAVLRYNQRGVGGSTGYKQIRGTADFSDVLDVTDFLAAKLPEVGRKLVVMGYSWGGCVAAHALRHPLVAAYVSVSFPLGGLSYILGTRGIFEQMAGTKHIPRLLILGSQDQFCSELAMVKAVKGAGGQLLLEDDSLLPASSGSDFLTPNKPERDGISADCTAPLQLRIWRGADHFWMEHLSEMGAYAEAWLRGMFDPDCQ